jgi:hypothetical protein
MNSLKLLAVDPKKSPILESDRQKKSTNSKETKTVLLSEVKETRLVITI